MISGNKVLNAPVKFRKTLANFCKPAPTGFSKKMGKLMNK